MKLQVIKDSIYFGGNGYKEGEVFEVSDVVGNELLSKKPNVKLFTKAKKSELKVEVEEAPVEEVEVKPEIKVKSKPKNKKVKKE